MNLLFLTMSTDIDNITKSGIYTDLIRKFSNEGHDVYVVYPRERREKRETGIIHNRKIHTLGVKTLNLTKTNIVEKGIGQILLEKQFKNAIRKFLNNVTFDIILYSTPPITFTKVIEDAKKNNPQAITYLLLKDIFPQNAVDLGLLSKSGIEGILYRFFKEKEHRLYRISDYIGCMSPANVNYILKHNPELDPIKLEIAPNSYDIPKEKNVTISTDTIRNTYKLPVDKPIFIYGGNMGKPQGIPFLIKCLDSIKDRKDCHFVIIGNGTEYSKLEYWYKINQPSSVSIFKYLPKEEYDQLAGACDVGLIFLDYRFTIPNYPSRLLTYLMKKKPIVAVTDPISDIGTIAEENKYGFHCLSNSVEAFVGTIDRTISSDIKKMGENGYQYFLNNYTIYHTYNAVVKHVEK